MSLGRRNSAHWMTLIFVATITILSCAVNIKSLGVTRPIPYNIELMKNESAGFMFEIQAVTSTERLLCTFSIDGLDGLDLGFREKEVIVEAGSIKNVYGTVTVPADAEVKTYNGKLYVSCEATEKEGVSGSTVKTSIGGSRFDVKVVELREKEIKEIAPPHEADDYMMVIIIAIIAIVLTVIVIIYYYRLKG